MGQGSNLQKILRKRLENYPEISPILIILSIIKGIMAIFTPTNLKKLKAPIKIIWDSIPVTVCHNLIENMNEIWKLCLIHKGRRLDREFLRKIKPN